MPERGFLNFWIFFLFFSEFSSPRRVWTKFGNKFFFLFFGLSHPVLAKNNAGKSFFNFLIFFSIFFGILLSGSSVNGIRDNEFFFLFLGLYHPVLAKNNAGKRFLNFLIFFLLFFLEFSCPGRVWTEFGTKFFFSISRPLSTRFG